MLLDFVHAIIKTFLIEKLPLSPADKTLSYPHTLVTGKLCWDAHI
jgi:hypothetical protein